VNSEPEERLGRGFVLQGFERTTDELNVELHLEPVPIDQLRSLFDVGDDPEMCDAIPWTRSKRAPSRRWSPNRSTSTVRLFLQRYA
jgi:hypothetical protein